MKEGPRWLTLSVSFVQIERVGLYVKRDQQLFVKLYDVEAGVFPDMAGDRPSIEVNPYVLVVKDALHQLDILSMGVSVQSDSHNVLVAVHEATESMPPPMRTLFQRAEV